MLALLLISAQEPSCTVLAAPVTSTAIAGKAIEVVVKVGIEPGWHIYWKNPGDSGSATTIDWSLPKGWAAVGLRYQVPHLINAGGIINFGYENEAMLIARLMPPEAYDGSPVTIGGEASYLICKEACVPGTRKFSIDLPGKPLSDRFVSTARAKLPIPFPGMIAMSYAAKKLVIQFEMGNVKSAYFFAENSLLADHSATQRLTSSGSANRLEIPLSDYLIDHPKTVAGVLSVTREDASIRGYDLELKP